MSCSDSGNSEIISVANARLDGANKADHGLSAGPGTRMSYEDVRREFHSLKSDYAATMGSEPASDEQVEDALRQAARGIRQDPNLSDAEKKKHLDKLGHAWTHVGTAELAPDTATVAAWSKIQDPAYMKVQHEKNQALARTAETVRQAAVPKCSHVDGRTITDRAVSREGQMQAKDARAGDIITPHHRGSLEASTRPELAEPHEVLAHAHFEGGSASDGYGGQVFHQPHSRMTLRNVRTGVEFDHKITGPDPRRLSETYERGNVTLVTLDEPYRGGGGTNPAGDAARHAERANAPTFEQRVQGYLDEGTFSKTS